MILSQLIQKSRSEPTATAISATASEECSGLIAEIATVAVAEKDDAKTGRRFLNEYQTCKPVPLNGANLCHGALIDVEALAGAIATEVRLEVAKILDLLDADDAVAITTGSDPGRADAWRYAAQALSNKP